MVVVVVVVWLVLVVVVVVVVIIVSVGNVGVVCALCAIITLRHPCSAACSSRLLLCPARPSSSSRVRFMPCVVLSSLALVLSPCPSLRCSLGPDQRFEHFFPNFGPGWYSRIILRILGRFRAFTIFHFNSKLFEIRTRSAVPCGISVFLSLRFRRMSRHGAPRSVYWSWLHVE